MAKAAPESVEALFGSNLLLIEERVGLEKRLAYTLLSLPTAWRGNCKRKH